MADEKPVLVPDLFHIEPVEIGIGVEGLLETVRITPVLQFAEDFTAEIHGHFLVLANFLKVAADRKGTAAAPGERVGIVVLLPAARRNPDINFITRLVSGSGAVLADDPGAFPDFSSGLLPRFLLHHRCGGSAGFRPASQFSALPYKGGTLSVFI